MKPRSCKDKGRKYEYAVARALTQYLADASHVHPDGELWMRPTVASGASRITGQAGDICSTNDLAKQVFGKTFIECKRIRRANLDKLLYGRPCPALAILDKAERQADAAGLPWVMLVLREDGTSRSVVVLPTHRFVQRPAKPKWTVKKIWPKPCPWLSGGTHVGTARRLFSGVRHHAYWFTDLFGIEP